MRLKIVVCLLAVLAAAPTHAAPVSVRVDPARGFDPRVDYASLLAFGPWDDRNYDLTLEDLAVLAPDEAENREAIPAFFRVRMRQARPELRKSGPAQYPRHAYVIFRQMFGGYLVDDVLYPTAARDGARWVFDRETGVRVDDPAAATAFVTGEVRVTSPNGAAESAIKVSPADPDRVIAGTNGPLGGQRMHYSTNGGTTWTQVNLPLGGTSGDPAVDWSSDGANAYTTTLGNCSFFGCQVWFYRSNDFGATWTGLESATPGDPRREIATSSADKEYLHVDKHATSPYKDRVYVTWHNNNVMQFAVSADRGNTFASQTFSNNSAELGIGSDIASGKNGEVWYFWPAFNSRTIRMRKSTNGGQTFGTSIVVASTQGAFTFPLPSFDARQAFLYVAADADLSSGTYGGSVYAAWTDATAPTTSNPSTNHGRVQVAYSRDGGGSWTVTTPHPTADALTVDRYHPWLAVGADGVVHVVYYDTSRSADRTRVDLFYAYSTDGAQTWSVPQRVTSVQSPNINDGFEWGDYNGLDIVLQNLIAIYTDNRDESGGTAQSVDVYAIGIPPGGASPGAGTVPDGDAIAGAPLTVDRSGGDVALSWSAACGLATDYAVYEGQLGVPNSLVSRLCSTGGATTATITPNQDAAYYLVVPLNAGNEGSYGRDGLGNERAPAATACATQQIAACSAP
ncbi:MAG TPA: sialidase family protein [Candidatus Polarisedimenticolaceae bacterium]